MIFYVSKQSQPNEVIAYSSSPYHNNMMSTARKEGQPHPQILPPTDKKLIVNTLEHLNTIIVKITHIHYSTVIHC